MAASFLHSTLHTADQVHSRSNIQDIHHLVVLLALLDAYDWDSNRLVETHMLELDTSALEVHPAIPSMHHTCSIAAPVVVPHLAQ